MTGYAVTGTGGFVGGALVPALERCGLACSRIARDYYFDAARRADLERLLDGIDVVIHCAALTPGLPGSTADHYDRANFQATMTLAEAARAAGVRRFVLVSTVAVIAGSPGPLRTDSVLSPKDAYAISKAKAETGLARIDIPERLIVRAPLVYGAGAKGHLATLVRLCASPFPLPFGSVENRRTMVGVSNLADALCFAASMPVPAGRCDIFHACDAEPLSIRRLVTEIRTAMGRPARLVNVPPGLLRLMAKVTGPGSVAGKLLDDSVVDGSRLFEAGWIPPVAPQTDIANMALAYLRVKAGA